MTIRYFLALTLSIALAAAAIPARTARAGPPERNVSAAGSGEKLDFTLPDVKGNPISLGSFRGKKPVLLVFWATWCPRCVESVADINRIHAESGGGDRMQVLALDYKESEAKVASFIREKQVAYTVLLDQRGSVARRFRILGIPTYILIDAGGRIVYRNYEPPVLSRILGPSALR